MSFRLSIFKTPVNLKAEVEPTERQVSSVQDELIRENRYVVLIICPIVHLPSCWSSVLASSSFFSLHSWDREFPAR